MTMKTVLITGAGSGIGQALAHAAANHGYRTILVGRRAEALAATATKTFASICVQADVTSADGRSQIKAAVGNRLDVLINNAGALQVGRAGEIDDAALGLMVQTNLLAPMALTRDLLPALRAARGRVVNVGSMFGDIAYPYFAAYSATKFGLRGYCDALRRELSGSGVGVTYAAPRATRTEATEEFDALIGPMAMALDAPETVAATIWTAIIEGRNNCYPGPKERLFVLIQRLFPGLIDRSVGAQARDPKVTSALAALRHRA